MSIEGDELIRRMRVALAEEGYGGATLSEGVLLTRGCPDIRYRIFEIPGEIFYRAATIAGVPMPCWSCWDAPCQDMRRTPCATGNCQAGPTTPKVPPRRIAAGVSSHKGGELK